MPNIKLEIIREAGFIHDTSLNWLNRYVQDKETKEILYYCEVEEGGKLIIHRGGKDGPVIATGDPCLEVEGRTDLHFLEPKLLIPLVHTHSKLKLKGKTEFTTQDQAKYHWNGHSELISDANNETIATFKESWLEGKYHRIGELDVSKREIQDIVVITALVVQERSDEHKRSAEQARDYQLKSSGI